MPKHYIVSNRSWPEAESGDEKSANTSLSEFSLYSYEFEIGKGCGKGDVQFLCTVSTTNLEARNRLLDVLFASSDNFEQRNLLFHIHGFGNDNTIAKGLIETLHLQHIYPGSPFQTIVLLAYPATETQNARTVACETGKYFARNFLAVRSALAKEFCPEKPELGELANVYMMANSLGNRVLESFVKEGMSKPELQKCLTELVLVASDVDNDIFFKRGGTLVDIGQVAQRTHIYYDKLDLVLQASQIQGADKPRLGHVGPKNLATPPSVFSVDVTQTVKKDEPKCVPEIYQFPLHHFYYLMNGSVVADIKRVFRSIEADDMTDRRPLRGEVQHFYLSDLEK